MSRHPAHNLLLMALLAVGLWQIQGQIQRNMQQSGMPAGLMNGVQDCPTNILFSIVATCTSIQSQLPTLVERLRDAIKIQEDPNDFSPSDIAKMRETSRGLCDMADPMLSCLSLLGKCPSLLGSLGGGVGDARGVLQVMCVNKSLDRYLDCTERNGGMNIRQRYCSKYRNYTILNGDPEGGGESFKSTISSLASFQGFGDSGLNPRESAAMNGIAGLMGTHGPKHSINCPKFTLFSGCMVSAVKRVCGTEESDSMYYVSQIQAKTGSDTCILPTSPEEAERLYIENAYKKLPSTEAPTRRIPVTTTRTPRVKPAGGKSETRWPGQSPTSFWMPNRLRQHQTTEEPQPNELDASYRHGAKLPSWWPSSRKQQTSTPGKKNVIVLQLATTPNSNDIDNNKLESELFSDVFEWSDDDEAMWAEQHGENAAPSTVASGIAMVTASILAFCCQFVLSQR